jgi:hypothetical protein
LIGELYTMAEMVKRSPMGGDWAAFGSPMGGTSV